MTKKCKNSYCKNEKSPDRSECAACRGKRRRGTDGTYHPKAPDGKMKVLMLDIETTPDKSYHWSRWGVNIGINQTIEEGGLVCFASKWYGQDEIEFYSQWEDGDFKMANEAWRLLDRADVVVHFYGKYFDIPHLNTAFLKQCFPPPSPFKQIDLKVAVGKQFKFSSNKLEFVSRVLGLEGKEEHEGFPMWDKVMNEVRRNGKKPFSDEIEADAKKRMEKYNKRDVFLLDEVFEVLLPWIPNMPNRQLYEGHGGCPTCGELLLVEDGYYYTALSKFLQYRCRGCDSWFRSGRREIGADLRGVVL